MRLGMNKKKVANKAKASMREITWTALAFRTIAHVTLGITATCIICYVTYNSIKSDAKNQQLSNHLAHHYGKIIQKTIINESVQFVSVIQDKVLSEWQPGQDEFALQQKIKLLKKAKPSIEAFHIVYSGQHEPRVSQPDLGYAAIDMAHKAFMGQAVPPEIHQVDGKKDFIDHVFPLRGQDNKIKAVAVVSQDLSTLQDVFSHYNQVPGFIELRETILGQNRLIAKSSRMDLAGVGIKSSALVPGTSWQINFWLDPAYTVNFQDGIPSLFATLIMLALIVTLLIWKNYQHMARLIMQDKDRLQAMLQSLADNNRPKSSDFNFRFSNQLSKYILQLGEQPKTLKLSKKHHEIMEPIMDWAMVSEISAKISPTIFRAYDIRGIAGETLNAGIMHLLGKSVGSEILEKNSNALVFGRDGRLSGEEYASAFCQGVRSTGVDVIDIGIVPTPLVYFGSYFLETRNAVMLTGSHNPANYNGLKIVIDGETLADKRIQGLLQRIQSNEFATGEGSFSQKDLLMDYIAKVTKHVHLDRPLKVVVDAGNGVGGVLVVPLLKAIGCDVIEMYCDVDGTFPNHHPDPSKPGNLHELMEMVQANDADVGLAFDGDGDRLGVVTQGGQIIWPDKLMMLFAKDVLSRHPGAPILYDVKCTKHLTTVIEAAGGKPIMCQTGHSLVKRALKAQEGILAGEMSGHFFFKENWYGFDDACFAAVKLLNILASDIEQRDLDALHELLPSSFTTPEINIAIADEEKFEFIEKLKVSHDFTEAKIITLDGLRIEMPASWGLVRASNTTPNLVLRFEADSQSELEHIQSIFKELLLSVKSDLEIPF